MTNNSKNSSSLTTLVKINGEVKSIPQNISILELLDLFKINKNRVVIELNSKILKLDNYASTTLNESDVIEIVTFVGGG